jgi:DNA-binding MarR family transcriptional regulator
LLYSQAIDDLATQLERRIALVTQLMRAHAPRGRSVVALLTLRRLDTEGPHRITELAAAELVAQPTMTVLVNRLESDGLVRKTRDAVDARAVRVEITDAGREQLRVTRAGRAAVLQTRLDRLDDEARAALAAALPALDQLLAT